MRDMLVDAGSHLATFAPIDSGNSGSDANKGAVAPVSARFTRRTFLYASTALGMLPAAGQGAPSFTASTVQNRRAPIVANRSPLAAQPFHILPAGTIKPLGWLRNQLDIQARGMGGRLDEIWPDVGRNSGWLGGTGESWERGPYFVDGLLPLAWQLDDAVLKAKAQRFIDWTLASAQPNGMFGPASNDDWWPRMVMLKVLIQYHELTGDARVITLMTDYFRYQLSALPSRPLKDWGRFRWQDELLSVIWLYNRTGGAWLLDVATLLKRQGFDWQGLFANYPFRDKMTKAALGMDTPDVPGEPPQGLKDLALSAHGVNNAQALKTSPVWSLVSGSDVDRQAVQHQLEMLDRFHGQPHGLYAADEHLAGRSPSQGTELCTVVEAMYSLQHALAITGDPAIGDRIEKIAYNALPATFTDDMWAHQYDQQPNQVQCTRAKGPWTTNGVEANLFGLEPNFGCCTANFHQGWPKLTASLFMASSDGGLAAMLYAPCSVTTLVESVPVTVRQQTDYPFRDTVSITIEPARPTQFPIRLRVPGWAQSVAIDVNGQRQPEARRGTFVKIVRTWRRGDRIEIRFQRAPRVVDIGRNAVGVELAPLIFSKPVEEAWTKLRDHRLTADWEVRPTSAWAYALSPAAPIARIDRAIGPVPFSRRDPPVILVTEASPVSNWAMTDGAADPVPTSPAVEAAPIRVMLMPYAAAKLRLTAFAVAPDVAPPKKV